MQKYDALRISKKIDKKMKANEETFLKQQCLPAFKKNNDKLDMLK